MKPIDLKCYKQVAEVIGEAYADYELQRVIDCEECQTNHHHDIKGKDLDGAFLWEKSPQKHEFWDRINCGKNPYEHGHKKPELSVPKSETGGNVTAASILEAGLRHMQDRAVIYDNPQGERSIGNTVDMFNVLYGLELTEDQGWAFMTILKLVRTSQGDFKMDSFEDMAAYAGLMGEAAYKLAQSDK